MLQKVEEVMEYVARARVKWIEDHPADFASEGARREYLSAWVRAVELRWCDKQWNRWRIMK